MAAQIGIKLLSFGFSIFVVRGLGAQIFGQYAAVLAFGATFAILSDLGLGVYVVRQVARWREDPGGLEQAETLYGNVLVLRLLLGLITILLVTGAAWLSKRPLVMVGAVALNATSLILYAVQGTSDAVLAGFERLDISAGAKVVSQLAFVCIGSIVLVKGVGYYGLIIANLVGVGLMTIVCWRGVRRLGVLPRSVDPRKWPALLRSSLPFGVIGFALGLSYKFDSVLLDIYRGDTETGYYNAAYNLIFSAVIFSNVLNTALYPSLARQAASAPAQLPKIYERALRYLMVVALPIAVGTWALADQIVPFLFQSSYLPAIPGLKILIWVVPLMFASEFLGYVVIIDGKEKYVARAVSISTGLNVAINLLLVPRFGFFGAAVMTLFTEAVLVGQYVWMLRKLIQQIDWDRSLLRPLLSTLLMGALVLVLRAHVPFIANVAIGAGVYFVILLLMGVIGRDELRFFRSLGSPSGITITQ